MNTKIYVGTYKKYNNGNLYGKWIDITDYSSPDEISEAMSAIHEDEQDPELMIQDMEDDAQALGVAESMSMEDWGEVYEALEAVNGSHLEFEAIKAYCNNMHGKITHDLVKKAEEAYAGNFDSDEEFAESMAEDMGLVNGDNSWPHYCIDWSWAARELMFDYLEANGYYFRNS